MGLLTPSSVYFFLLVSSLCGFFVCGFVVVVWVLFNLFFHSFGVSCTRMNVPEDFSAFSCSYHVLPSGGSLGVGSVSGISVGNH